MKLDRAKTWYRFAWRNNPRRAELYGRRCRIIAVGRLGSVLLEFENGERVVASRRALRATTPPRRTERRGPTDQGKSHSQ